MKKEEAIRIMWYNLTVGINRVKRVSNALEGEIQDRNPEKSGDAVKELLKEVIEIYTRLGVIGALEEIS